MKQPYFEVGERVLLYSKTFGVNGYEVSIVDRAYDSGRDAYSGEHIEKCWNYRVTPDPINEGGWWHQECLRKKHDPGDSFESIMQKLKNPMEV